ncbi:hypothetical protein D3C85_1570210 [compost metagenome]
MCACRLYNCEYVAKQILAHLNVEVGSLRFRNVSSIRNRLKLLKRIVRHESLHYMQPFFRGRVTHLDLEQETVKLRLRQRECSLLLNRILRSDDEKRLRQPMRSPVNRHLALLHTFQ